MGVEYMLNGVSKGIMFSGLPTTSPVCLATTMNAAHSTVEIQRASGSVEHGLDGNGHAMQSHMPSVSGWDVRTATHNQAITVGPLHKVATRENFDAGNAETVRAGCVVGDGEWKVRVGFPRGEGTRETYLGVQQLGTVACRWLGCSVFSWGAMGTGKLAHNNVGNIDGGFTMDDRDLITVRLKDGTLQFDKNGIGMGALFRNLPRDKPLCLAATLSAPSATVTIVSQPALVNQQPVVSPADWSTGSPTVWDEGSIYPREGGLFSLDAQRKVVSRTNNFKLATIEGHCYVGHGSWKVELQAQQHNQRGGIAVDYVGVQVAGTQCAWVGCNTNSWGIRSDGRRSHAGSNEIMGGFEIHDDDIIEVVAEEGKLFFKKNGVPQGKMFDGLPTDQALCFAVTMYSPASSATFLRPPPACALPPKPTSGTSSIQGQWVGALATFECEEGYIMSGSAQRRCSQSGAWTGETTFCNKDPCGKVTAPVDGTVKTKVVKGVATALYECADSTFELVGEASRQCSEANGQWSAPAPVCRKKCGRVPPAPEHAKVSFNATHAGSTAVYTCKQGYFMSGLSDSSVITCQDDGLWSDSPPSCTPLRCNLPKKVKHSVSSVSCQHFGCIRAYECESPYQLIGTSETTCQADGMWSPAPECVILRECQEVQCKLHDQPVMTRFRKASEVYPKWRTIVRHPTHEVPEPHGQRHRCQFEKLGVRKWGRCKCECWDSEDKAEVETTSSAV